MAISQIRKRDGSIESFNPQKIVTAIEKAMNHVDEGSKRDSEKTAKEVVRGLEDTKGSFFRSIPSVEQVQDQVEETLSKSRFQRTAKAYMLYRRSRKEARELKRFFGIKDDLKFDVNAIRVLQERYLLKDKEGRIIETPTQLFRRVAKAIASVEKKGQREYEERFFEMMSGLEFLPNSPTLMNAGTDYPLLSACFVLPIEDSLESIFETLENSALIQQRGGGTGFNFSHLRPKGDIVKSTKGIASGPVSFIKIYDTTTETIKQGGKRRGANMAILDVSHPDILEFIASKQKEKQLSNFNISVAVDDKFMKAVEKNRDYFLINPRTNKIVAKLNAKSLFSLICKFAWRTGDPGMIFLNEINRKSQVPGLGKIESTNPCGEQPLLPYESCNLGSINLTKVIENGKIDWNKLKGLIQSSVRFLDNVIDAQKIPISEIQKMTKANRRIGLGVMGFAEMLVLLGIPYGSRKALQISEKLMSFMSKEAHAASIQLGKEKGNFPNFQKSVWKGKTRFMRNCALTTIAPTGTISIIAGCSSGIEPLFAIAFMREVLAGKHLFEVNKTFQKIAISKGFYSEKLMKDIAIQGTLKKTRLPQKIKDVFKTALEISPEHHIRMQAIFQKHTDNAVSKCVTGDALIFSEKGILPIKKLGNAPEGQFSYNPLRIYSNPGVEIARDFYNGGKRKTIKIETRYGYSIEGTPNHKIYVIDKNGDIAFRQLSDIKSGDYAVIQRGQNFFGNEKKLPKFDYKDKTNSKRHRLPKNLNRHFAYFLGCVTSEGSLTKNNVQITHCNLKILNKLGKISKGLFGLNSRISKDNRNGVTTLVINSRKLVRFLESLGINRGAKNKTIPDCIMQSTKENIIAFLNGLFLDAYIPTKSKNRLGICLASKDLIKQLQIILLNLGIISNIFNKKSRATNSKMKERNYYELQVCGGNFKKIVNLIDFDEPHKKRNSLKNISDHYNMGFNDIVPSIDSKLRELIELSKKSGELARKKGYGVFKKGYLATHNIKAERLKEALRFFDDVKESEIYRELAALIKLNYFYDKITDIKNSKNNVYDFCVPSNNRFFANGFINHNTINLPHNATEDDVKNAYLLAHRLKCKGITLYRYGSKPEQVLYLGEGKKPTKASIEFTGGTCIGKVCAF